MMHKRMKKFGCLLMAFTIVFTGCGKINGEDSGQNSIATYAPNAENKELRKVEITAEQGYQDDEKKISFYGLKEYTKFKNGKMVEKPEKGKKYLVLYLNIENRAPENFYFNENNFSSKLDGKDYEHTVLFSDPEPYYVTCFHNVLPATALYGFIVWEVPNDWKTLDIKYTGLEGSDGATLNMNLTPEDLQEPHDISRLGVKDGLAALTE